jgi:hypothetical protein
VQAGNGNYALPIVYKAAVIYEMVKGQPANPFSMAALAAGFK